MRKTSVLAACALFAVALAAGACHPPGSAQVLAFTESQLRSVLERQLPFKRRHMLVFDVTLDNPRITLVDGRDRLDGAVDVDVDVHIGRQVRTLTGSIDFSCAVRYVAERAELVLIEPVIERIELPGLPVLHASEARDALKAALQDFVAARPIRAPLSGGGSRLAGRVLKDVLVVDRRLTVTLGR